LILLIGFHVSKRLFSVVANASRLANLVYFQIGIIMAFIPSDTRFNLQWHLLNNTPGEYDLNVVDVWDDYTGAGVRVVALDLGFDYTHPDYDNYRTDLDWDFENNDSVALPDPDENDSHGTPVLGIIGAAQDGQGTVGIAFGADIIGYKTDFSRDEVEAAIELATTAGHDIISMSYGEGNNVFVRRDTLVDAAETAAETGRGGLGLIMVKSAGNSRRDADNIFREETTAEALENARYTIVVAGVSDTGELPPIANQLGPDVSANKSSSPGANILTTAFYGRDGNSVQTTYITGSQGFSPNDYTGFSGTSAAAPQVAGVIALILEANPNLGWRDVQDIIAYSSLQIGSQVGALAEGEEQATQLNGLGFKFQVQRLN
jgi:subtilisin family serine protease